jgi:hypothetical protein
MIDPAPSRTDPIGPVAQATLKMGTHRGSQRLWIEGAKLAAAGFKRGDRYDLDYTPPALYGPMILISAAESGRHHVAGRNRNGRDIPIIDRHNRDWHGFGERVNVDYYAGGIVIVTPVDDRS